jgi:hypothetical protein
MLVAKRDVAAVLSPVGVRCSRDDAMVLMPGPVGTRRPDSGIWNRHDDGALKGECTTWASSEASWLPLEQNWPGWDDSDAWRVEVAHGE